MTIIRPYIEADFPHLVRFLREFQLFLAEIDEMHYVKPFTSPEDDEQYAHQLLKDAAEREGAIFMAEVDSRLVGFVQGIIDRHSDDSLYLLSHNPGDHGWIGELYVDEAARSQGVGKLLVKEMTSYFQEKGCVNARLRVLASNQKAITFYQELGFATRDLEMFREFA